MKQLKFAVAHIIQYFTLKSVKIGFIHKSDASLIRLGSEYGGYWMPSSVTNNRITKSLVSLGLGFDISLDLKLLSLGFIVLGVEPSQNSCNYVSEQLNFIPERHNFILVQAAVSDVSGFQVFERPNLKSNYQWWATEMSNDSERATVVTTTIERLYTDNQDFFQSDLNILKMDIEGSEIAVLSSLISNSIAFDYLAVEMDYISLIPTLNIFGRISRVLETRQLFAKMEKFGYRLILTEGYNFFWISSSIEKGV